MSKNPIESIQLPSNAPIPLYLNLYGQLKDLIENGQLESGSKLPSIRTMAKNLQVNTVTVIKAYDLLERENLVKKHVGQGTYVSPGTSFEEALEVEQDVPGLEDRPDQAKTYNFASLSPSPELFPVAEIKEYMNRVLEKDRGLAFSYQESQGYLPLRKTLLKPLQENGIHTSEDKIQIISGGQQGIDIIARVLLEFGHCVLVEEPTYPGALAVFQGRGAQVMSISMEKDGVNMDELEEKLKKFKPRFFYAMTNFQNPTGCTYSSEKKKQLLELAQKHNFYILEDSYLEELDYSPFLGNKTPVSPSLKSMDRQERVIYLKSFSKILMPGLRIGFLVLPEPLKAGVLNAKHAADISTSGLIQRTLKLYLDSGRWKNHLNKIKKEYFQRYEILRDFLKSQEEYLDFYDPCGGLCFWARLKVNMSSDQLAEQARIRGVKIASGAHFTSYSKPNPFFRLSFAGINCPRIREGTAILKEILENYSSFPDEYTPLI